ncbi:MAG: HD domain-containing protein [Caldilineaceae bacterium]
MLNSQANRFDSDGVEPARSDGSSATATDAGRELPGDTEVSSIPYEQERDAPSYRDDVAKNGAVTIIQNNGIHPQVVNNVEDAQADALPPTEQPQYPSNGYPPRLPLPNKPRLDPNAPPPPAPLEPVALALTKIAPLPTADGTAKIEITPSKEEQQALEQLFQALPANFPRPEYERLLRAYAVASYAHRAQNRESGEPYMIHPLAVTKILVEMRMDANTLAAGLLHDVAEDSEFTIEYINEHFGEVVSMLVDGVTKLKRIKDLGNTHEGMSVTKAESLRKMFLAMVEDIRVVLIKLADRLHNMRTLGGRKSTSGVALRAKRLKFSHPWPIVWGSGRSNPNWKISVFAISSPTAIAILPKPCNKRHLNEINGSFGLRANWSASWPRWAFRPK